MYRLAGFKIGSAATTIFAVLPKFSSDYTFVEPVVHATKTLPTLSMELAMERRPITPVHR
jgi:hypothetical protein